MGTAEGKICACSGTEEIPAPEVSRSDGARTVKYILWGIPMLAAWWAVYLNLAPFAHWLAHRFVNLLPARFTGPGNAAHLESAVEFFIYDTPKVLMLLVLVVFGVGVIRSFFTPERTRRILAGKRESVGNVLAAMLGIVTPFCSCSVVPLFIGFVTASVPLG